MATKLVIMTNPTIKTIITIVSNEIEISPMIVAVNAIGIVIGIVIVTVIVIVPATATMPAPSLTSKPTNPALDLAIAPEMMTLSPMKMNNHF